MTNAAIAINEFLYNLSLGYTPEVAFERACPGTDTYSDQSSALRMPSNLSITLKEKAVCSSV